MRSTDQKARQPCHKHGGNPCATKNHNFPTHIHDTLNKPQHKHNPTQGIPYSNCFTFTTSYIKQSFKKMHVDYTTKCLPGMNQKERYALNRHLLRGYWPRGPLRHLPSRMTLHQSPLPEGVRDNSRQSLRRMIRIEHMRSDACINKFCYPPFILTTQFFHTACTRECVYANWQKESHTEYWLIHLELKVNISVF